MFVYLLRPIPTKGNSQQLFPFTHISPSIQSIIIILFDLIQYLSVTIQTSLYWQATFLAKHVDTLLRLIIILSCHLNFVFDEGTIVVIDFLSKKLFFTNVEFFKVCCREVNSAPCRGIFSNVSKNISDLEGYTKG